MTILARRLNVKSVQDRTDSARFGLVLTVHSNWLTSILDRK
jgi:hypothetical protein